MEMEHDDGFSFGLGVFETMLVVGDRCVMMERHLDRMNRGLETIGLGRRMEPEMMEGIVSDGHLDGRILKIEVSERNTIVSDRPVPYTPEDYERGFVLRTSAVRRNETSPFTFIKSLQYGDSIMEKRRARSEGFDEPLFLNGRGEICEGATTNIFFTDGRRIVTPDISCGMLPGTVRSYVLERFDVEERSILPGDIGSFSGCFVTNSVLGIMPVSGIDGFAFTDRSVADSVRARYERDVSEGL